MLANSDYTHLEYSPDDKYIIAVSKYNLQQPNKNLHLILAATGQILAEWEWRKTPIYLMATRSPSKCSRRREEAASAEARTKAR